MTDSMREKHEKILYADGYKFAHMIERSKVVDFMSAAATQAREEALNEAEALFSLPHDIARIRSLKSPAPQTVGEVKGTFHKADCAFWRHNFGCTCGAYNSQLPPSPPSPDSWRETQITAGMLWDAYQGYWTSGSREPPTLLTILLELQHSAKQKASQ